MISMSSRASGASRGIRTYAAAVVACVALGTASCGGAGAQAPDPPPSVAPAVTTGDTVSVWLTAPDRSSLLARQRAIAFGAASSTGPTITVDGATTYQTMDGFGYTLTGSSALVIHRMPDAARAALLRELFGRDDASLGVSYLRLSIGASDLSPASFTYDEMPAGQTDTALASFTIDAEKAHLVPLLKEILAINPNVTLLGDSVDRAALDEGQRLVRRRQSPAAVLPGVRELLREVHPGDEGGGNHDRRDHAAERAAQPGQRAEPRDDRRAAGAVHQVLPRPRAARRRSGDEDPRLRPQRRPSGIRDVDPRRCGGECVRRRLGVPPLQRHGGRAVGRPRRASGEEPLLHRAVHALERPVRRRPALASPQRDHRRAGQLEPHRARVEPRQRREVRPAHAGRLHDLPRRRHDRLGDVER